MKKMALVIFIGLFLLVLPIRAQINFLYEFTNSAGDGASPSGLILSGTTLYGTTNGVSTNTSIGCGTIFKIETDGSGFTLLHTFTGGAADGKYPGDLIISGTTLYGMTMYGGGHDSGTIFKIGTDGSGFALLHEFSSGAADGAFPQGSLILSGSTFYGMTMKGGEIDKGTIFKIETDGSGFTLLHTFTYDDGSTPRGSLIISDTTLYGMTQGVLGNNNYCGTIFKIETNGSGFTLLHTFAGGAEDGEGPFGDLLLANSTLYGMTRFGGDSNLGTIFKMQKDGSGFNLLHEFAGSPADGEYPFGSLIISGTTLYGMTSMGGGGGWGTIFTIQTNSTGFALLHEFSSSFQDASFPNGTPLLFNSTLYGAVSAGGSGHYGVIFSLPLPSITITSPNGGENWIGGTTQNITWSSTGTIANVNINYSLDNGSNWSRIFASVPNSGTYTWTVPTIVSTACLVRVSDAANPATYYDISDGVFTIAAAPSFIISGQVKLNNGKGLAGVLMRGLPGNPLTDANGMYSATVKYGFSGIALPRLTGYYFVPYHSYKNVTSDLTSQNYAARPVEPDPIIIDQSPH